MEVALVSPTAIRVKGKVASFVVDPTPTKGKIQAEAILLLQEPSTDVAVEGSRITIAGPGEYEISGVKITGVKNGSSTSYFLSLDAMTILVSMASGLKGKESLRDVDIAILSADSVVDQSALTTVASGVAIFYGSQAGENSKALGKEVQPISKYVITKDKLPQEMEVILLQQ